MFTLNKKENDEKIITITKEIYKSKKNIFFFLKPNKQTILIYKLYYLLGMDLVRSTLLSESVIDCIQEDPKVENSNYISFVKQVSTTKYENKQNLTQ